MKVELVGRDRITDHLQAAIDRALSGSFVAAAVSGPAGSGKTELLRMVDRTVSGDGWAVARVTGHRDVIATPYFSIAALVDQLAPLHSEAREEDREFASSPNWEQSSVLARNSALALSTLRKVAAGQPVALFIDDLQWLDDSSIKVLDYVAAQSPVGPILVLFSLRDGTAFSPALSSLVRRCGADLLSIEPLDPDGTGQLLAQTLGRPAEEHEVHRVHRDSGGLPLLIKLLARDIGASSSSGRNAALDVVLSYLSELPGPQYEALNVLAVIGRPAILSVWSAIAGKPPENVMSAADSAIAAGFLTLDSDNSYWFAHPLMAEALVATVADARANELHRAAAEYFASRRHLGVEYLFEAARHAAADTALADRRMALDLALSATEVALDSGDWQSGRRFLQMAERAGSESDSPRDRARLLFGKARCLPEDSDFKALRNAWALIEESFGLFVQCGETSSAVDVASYPLMIGGIDGAVDLIERAIGLVPDGSVEQGWLLARYGIALADQGSDRQAIEALESASEIAERQHAGDLLARADVHRSQAHYRALRPAESIKAAERALATARSAGDHVSQLKALPFLFLSSLMVGDVDRARKVSEMSGPAYENFPDPQYSEMQSVQRLWLAHLDGEFDLALEILGENYPLERAKILFKKGEIDAADEVVAEQFRLHPGGEPLHWQLIYTATVGIFSRPRQQAESLQPSQSPWIADAMALREELAQRPIETRLGLLELDLFDAALESVRPEGPDCKAVFDRLSRHTVLFHPDTGLLLSRVRARLCSTFGDDDAAARLLAQAAEQASRPGLRSELEAVEQDLTATGRSSISARSTGDLTPRELEVVRLLSGGLTNHEIAQRLHLSPHTVGHHVRHALNKTGAPNRTALAALISSSSSAGLHSTARLRS